MKPGAFKNNSKEKHHILNITKTSKKWQPIIFGVIRVMINLNKNSQHYVFWLRKWNHINQDWALNVRSSPGFEVVQKMITDFRLFLVELGKQVQQNGEAAVIFLHLTQVPEDQTHRLTHRLLQWPANTRIKWLNKNIHFNMPSVILLIEKVMEN